MNAQSILDNRALCATGSALLAAAGANIILFTLGGSDCTDHWNFGMIGVIIGNILLLGTPTIVPAIIGGAFGWHTGRKGLLGAAIALGVASASVALVFMVPHALTQCRFDL